MLRVKSLFSGIGGFELGLSRAGGFKPVSFCEMKPHAQAVLAKNFPGVPCHDDVTTCEHKEGEADVITAGFPCQDISYAGLGAGLSGARSGLYREVIRAVRVVRPLYALLENVAALLSRGLDTVLGDLAAIGYDAEWHCIPASAVGAPHRRDRIWIIAHARGEQHEGNRPPLSGALSEELSRAYLANTSGERWDGSRSGAQPSGRDKLADGREKVADATSIGQPGSGQPLVTGHQTPSREGKATNAFDGRLRDERPAQSDLGRMVDGLSQKLDGDGIDETRLANSQGGTEGSLPHREELPEMRRDASTTTPPSGLFETGGSRNSLPILPRGSGQGGRLPTDQADETMQGVRGGLSSEPQQETRDLQPRMPFEPWPHERDEALGIWSQEPDIPRIAHGIRHRVDRLAELGNAVVPQIPEMIGRAILSQLEAA